MLRRGQEQTPYQLRPNAHLTPTKRPPPTWLSRRHGCLEMFAGDDGKREVEKEDVEGDDSELRAEEGIRGAVGDGESCGENWRAAASGSNL